MSKNSGEFKGSGEAALQYIRGRGYCSYSPMVNVRDRKAPELFVETDYFRFGKELHSRFLEHKKIIQLPPADETLLKKCINNLADDPKVIKIMTGAQTEVEFDEKVNGMRTYGRIDILNFAVGDLKTTRLTNRHAFAAYMDFLQAALYMRVTGKKDFYYIGISKEPPHAVMVFSVNQYPDRLREAQDDLNRLTKYIKKKL